MRKLLLLLLLTCSISTLFAQHYANQNKVWAFGTRAGVNFTSGTPVAISCSMSTSEGCASVADASGNLLFYTDGVRVYDRTHAVMSGSPLVSYGTASSTQGALITPKPGSPNHYYVFSLEQVYSGSVYCRLAYSEVDMTLAGGLGDVVTSTRGTSMTNRLSEKMIAVPGSNCDIWVLVHRIDSTIFLAYNISSAGISSPVVSTVGTFTATGGLGGYGVGVMKASPDSRTLVTQSYSGGTRGQGTEIYDFNPATGVVSNVRVLDSLLTQYGAEFSPDNTKLYTQGGSNLYQYDLSAGTAAAIRATRTSITTGSGYPQMRLGPDNKIYLVGMGSTGFLDVINNPNVAGTGCGYAARAVTLVSGTSGVFGLPSMYVDVAGGDTTYYRHDTTACIPISGSIRIGSHISDTAYVWNDGVTTSTRTITTPGQYWVISHNACTYNVDSIYVSTPRPTSNTFRHDTSICRLIPNIRLNARAGWPFYEWNTGSTSTSLTVATSGTYWIKVYDSCLNSVTDTYHVAFIAPDTIINSSHDSAICITARTMRLNAPPGGFSSYYWSTGSTASSITVSATGSYILYAYQGCNVYVDTFHVLFIPEPIVNIGNDTAFCVGGTIVLSSIQPAGYTYEWNTGSRADTIHASSTDVYWLRVYNGCYVTDSIHVLISPFPIVDLGPDLFNCSGAPFTLQSAGTFSAPTYAWNTGASTSSIVATSTGTYWESISVAGCAAADTIQVTIYHDTLRLLNRDTAICRGQFIQAMANINPDATCQWLPTAGMSNSRIPMTMIRPDTSAMYVVHVYLTGCPEISDSFFVDVQPIPSVFAGGNRFVCEFDTLNIRANVSPMWYGGYIYNWSPATGLDLTTSQTVVFTPGISTKYSITVTTPIGCRSQDSILVTVNPGNFATLSPGGNLCPHDSIQMFATGGTSYRWLPSRYVDDSTSASPWIKAITSTQYSMIATSAAGCNDTLKANINVFPGALISLPDSIVLYPGDSYQLQPLTNCVSFTWFPSAGLNYNNIINPLANPITNTDYYVDGVTSDGCKTRAYVNVMRRAHTLFTAPNAFTPGSGINNKFRLIRRGDGGLSFFRIFNRWGNVVFETKDVNEGWDGTFNGEPQPFGVYIYEIEAIGADGMLWNKRGNVTLLR